MVVEFTSSLLSINFKFTLLLNITYIITCQVIKFKKPARNIGLLFELHVIIAAALHTIMYQLYIMPYLLLHCTSFCISWFPKQLPDESFSVDESTDEEWVHELSVDNNYVNKFSDYIQYSILGGSRLYLYIIIYNSFTMK